MTGRRLLLLCWLTTALLAAEGAQVGIDSDLCRLQFVGLETIAPAALAESLLRDVPVLDAAHPFAPRDRFLAVLAERTLLGYRHAGFKEATVSAEDGPEGPVLTIHEGPRWRKGAVTLTGSTLADTIRAHLASGVDPISQPDKNDTSPNPIWKADEPAPFDEPTRVRIEHFVQRVYSAHGHPRAAVTVTLAGADDHRATLTIAVTDEGPAMVIGDLRCTGLVRETPESVRLCAAIPTGSVLSPDLIRDIRTRLRNSGRFATVTVTPLYDQAASGIACPVAIDVGEYAGMPSLTEPLGEGEAVANRFRAWTQAWLTGHEPEDLITEIRHANLTWSLCVSPSTKRVLLRLRSGPAVDWTHAILLAGETLTAWHLVDGSAASWTIPTDLLSITIPIAVRPSERFDPTDPKETGPYTFSITPGFHSDPGGIQAPEIDIDPAVFIHAFCSSTRTIETGDGQTRSWDQAAEEPHVITIDTATGRLVSLTGKGPGIRFVRNALTEALASLPVVPDPGESSALLDLLALSTEELLTAVDLQADTRLELERALRLAATLGRACLALAGTPRQPPEDDAFSIPSDGAPTGNPQLDLMRELAALVHGLARSSTVRGSWPELLSREAVSVLGGANPYTGTTLASLYADPRTGPLGCLSVAACLDLIGQQQSAGAFISQGRDRANAQSFAEEIRCFAPVAPSLLAILGAIDDPAAVAAVLDQGTAEQVSAILAAARARDGDPTERLATCAAALWNLGLGDAILRGFDHLGGFTP